MTTINNVSITALILAGGRAARMGGIDKGMIDCGGQPLIERMLHKVEPLVENVLISANRNLEDYAAYGHPVLSDTRADFPGPLAGIERGLEACTTSHLWILPCDAPLFEAELLQRLAQVCDGSRVSAAVPNDGHYLQATFALLRTDVLTSLHEFLAEGQRKAGDWLLSLHAAQVDCADHPEWFMNINTLADLERCENEVRQWP